MLVLGGAGVLGLAGVATGIALWGRQAEWSPPYAGAESWVSLSPAITEALFGIGAGAALVGRTNECVFPRAAARLRNVGPMGQPDPKILEELSPTGVLAESSRVPSLPPGLPITELPWRNAADVATSLRELGEMFQVADRAEFVAERMDALAEAEVPDGGPRVMLALHHAGTRDGYIRFAPPNQLRGQALTAAGFRNAVNQQIDGPSAEMSFSDAGLLEPDALVILDAAPATEARKREVLTRYEGIPNFKPTQTQQIAVLSSIDALSRGPAVLSLATRIQKAMAALAAP